MKSTVIFRGREIVHSEIGREILERLAAELGDGGLIESPPRQEGNTMVQILAPKKEVVPVEAEAGRRPAAEAARRRPAQTASETMRKPKAKGKLKLKTKRAAVEALQGDRHRQGQARTSR